MDVVEVVPDLYGSVQFSGDESWVGEVASVLSPDEWCVGIGDLPVEVGESLGLLWDFEAPRPIHG